MSIVNIKICKMPFRDCGEPHGRRRMSLVAIIGSTDKNGTEERNKGLKDERSLRDEARSVGPVALF